jgi:hypothetical protein
MTAANGAAARWKLIDALAKARDGRTVITYVTSTRPNLSASMKEDQIPVIHNHLQGLGPKSQVRLDLFLHTSGGDNTVPWRLMSVLREYAQEVNILVPGYCYSAGTLTALGADEVVMHPMGVLGPTDPTSHSAFNPVHPLDDEQQVGISVEDVAHYVKLVKEDVGVTNPDELMLAFSLLAKDVHPLALGNVKRLTQQMEMLGLKMLGLRKDNSNLGDLKDVVNKLNRELFYHGHPISREEAREAVGLKFVRDATSEEEVAMWALYRAYADDMRLSEEWNVFAAAAEQPGGLPAIPRWTSKGAVPPPPTVESFAVQGVKYVYIESATRSDWREVDYEITVSRQWDGEMDGKSHVTRAEWRATERAKDDAP